MYISKFLKATIYFLLFIFITSCDKGDEPTVDKPTINSTTSQQNAEVTYTSIKISGNVVSSGETDVIERGVCWSKKSNPSINDSKTQEMSNTFTSTIEGLTANTTYHFRVYATNATGTGYGEDQSFSTSSLANTKWDFFILFDVGTRNSSWHADIEFKPDGTTVYDEPEYPGRYTAYGTWTLKDNTLTYILNPENVGAYEFTGTLIGNTMSGTYTLRTAKDQEWTAVKY